MPVVRERERDRMPDVTTVTSSRKKSKTTITKAMREKVAELGKTDLTQEDIAGMIGIERSTVSKILKSFKVHKEQVETFKDERADAMAVIQREILSNITVDEIKKAPLQTKMMSYGILYDKERLERGQSTSNESIIVTQIRDMRERLSGDDVNRD